VFRSPDKCCLFPDRRVIEYILQPKLDIKALVNLGRKLHRFKGMSAQFKEMIIDAVTVNPEHFRPQPVQLGLIFIARSFLRAVRHGQTWFRQGGPIDFPIRREREGVKHDKCGRNHIIRERSSQLPLPVRSFPFLLHPFGGALFIDYIGA